MKQLKQHDNGGQHMVKDEIKLDKMLGEIKDVDDVVEKKDIERTRSKFVIPTDEFPPCMKNILELKTPSDGKLVGRTRAKAEICRFLYHAGWSKSAAKSLFKKVSKNLGGPESNIFKFIFENKDSFCSSCKSIQTVNETAGFPDSREIGHLHVCTPDEKCKYLTMSEDTFTNPAQYIKTRAPVISYEIKTSIKTKDGIRKNHHLVFVILSKKNVKCYCRLEDDTCTPEIEFDGSRLTGKDSRLETIGEIIYGIGMGSRTTKNLLVDEIIKKVKTEIQKKPKFRPLSESMDKDEAPIEIIPSSILSTMEGKKVKITGQIVSEKGNTGIPHSVEWQCHNYSCSHAGSCKTSGVTFPESFFFKPKNSTISSILHKNAPSYCIKNLDEIPKWVYNVKSNIDFSLLWICDRIEDQTTETKSANAKVRVYLMGEERPGLCKPICIEGYVCIDPHTLENCVIGNKFTEVGTSFDNLVLTDDDKKQFIRYFKDKGFKNLHQIDPKMKGRDIVKKARLLTLHSPMYIPDSDGKKIRGCIHELLYGDSKTNKSKSVKEVINTYGIGEWFSGETTTRTGLTYAIDITRETINWGILPINDGGYVGIDSINSFKKGEWAEMRESLEDMRIKVNKFVRGIANCRVRITAVMNLSAKKVMRVDYLAHCASLADTETFEDSPDITRMDFALPFSGDDVTVETIVDGEAIPQPIPSDIFAKHIYWGWGIKCENIVTHKDIEKLIKKKFKIIYKRYNINVFPFVNLGTLDTLKRTCDAMAILNHSTDKECVKIFVREKDVDDACKFFEEMLDANDLGRFKSLIEDENILDDDLYDVIWDDLDTTHSKILRILTRGRCNADTLKTILKVSLGTIHNHYSKLTNYGLIHPKPHMGASLTPKGVMYCTKLLLSTSKSKDLITDTECEMILTQFLEGHREIMMKVSSQRQNVSTISEKSKVSEETIKKRVHLLKEYYLIEHIEGYGMRITKRGKVFCEWLEKNQPTKSESAEW